ncbi:serine acetyltransferase 1, chloroplastic-like isoform X4 [Olea europaea var. sylvestris]|uniref:serine acetyltransferase 1, chloroplastic-like isoform X1 n=1 Tax=Olea europaea var. sylvestris TaxID=158386 RepID=UPI000C1D43EB|nr:serine acetyltransferase 1, chloroplastic-like isoform X1 [Olea europaea var. sylvestris]XP_022843516.1 serine acetyltransferase 1, chloroplastic-like isoform X2 [Olea europaea var. sylvestris]XP_022843517.1 serine acetyltransferase 1, chloroplastic-like isoform X3 [Olea europaea var. sylvestris]XP_022843518.1 serine acetyltransferase 1, chloroplastic-like isoform X4 [Olea europaea var. sylvestris]
MKVLAFLLSTSPSLYNFLTKGPHFLAPRISVSANFLGSQFKRPVLKPVELSVFAMATCVHTSRTETPPQTKPNKTQVDDCLFQNFVKYCRPNSADIVSCAPISEKRSNTLHMCAPTGLDDVNINHEEAVDNLWKLMKDEARSDIDEEPILSNYYFSSILLHDSMESALANHLAMKLSNSMLPSGTLYDLFVGLLTENQDIMRGVKDDLRAVKERDPACISYVHCFLNFKGYLACQAHRVAHKLWLRGRKILALLIQNRVSEVFAVDIHPGAKIGRGILLDHATGVVIGETAVIGDNVSILHNVTLGGTGKVSGDRHPKIGDGVLIGAGTCVLGNVRIEDGAKIGAGSVVLKQVPARTTAVGNPAKLIGGKENPTKLDKLPSLTMDHTSHISEWSDWVI